MFYIKENDTSPAIQITCQDYNDAAVDVTGASVRFIMKNLSTGNIVADGAGTIVDGVNGIVKYSWVAGDTNTPGDHDAEFEITYADTKVETFPNSGYIRVVVNEELG